MPSSRDYSLKGTKPAAQQVVEEEIGGYSTDGFYLPDWMLEVLERSDRKKSHVVETALYEYFEQQGLIPREVIRGE